MLRRCSQPHDYQQLNMQPRVGRGAHLEIEPDLEMTHGPDTLSNRSGKEMIDE
ncbi:hypothetical protein Syun_003296 [Stephania yunnanensis]|uniref:Uncharacterized protein n=1 Tax=Stephania yunnanensis TaxID=152371 RepID=A0AAP0L300_9MAGN